MPPTDGLRAELLRARRRSAALSAVACALGDGAVTPHAARRDLAAWLGDAASSRALAWPAVQGARDALAALDARIDRALRGLLITTHAPLEALAGELAQCDGDVARTRRSLAIAYAEWGPPASRANARMVDVLRTPFAPLGPSRLAVYDALVDHGADVRVPLADDPRIDAFGRTHVLSRFAARTTDAGRRRAVHFAPDALVALARALADWSAHATHPRQLFHGFQRALGLVDHAARRDAVAPLERYALAPEVRDELARQCEGTPVELEARALGAGRYECARCGEPTVQALDVRALDDDDPTRGAETRLACTRCAMAYFAVWETDGVDTASAPAARGWSEG